MGSDSATEEEHIVYARRAMRDMLYRGEAPYASHLLYTQEGVLDDADPAEREMGIRAGFSYRGIVAARAFYLDFGMSRGMHHGYRDALRSGQIIYWRGFWGPCKQAIDLTVIERAAGWEIRDPGGAVTLGEDLSDLARRARHFWDESLRGVAL